MNLEEFKNKKSDIIRSFARVENDTGSSEVQIALLTSKIIYLAEHLKRNPKDLTVKRRIMILVANRASILNYLRGTRYDSYVGVVEKLNLKKR